MMYPNKRLQWKHVGDVTVSRTPQTKANTSLEGH